MTRRDVGLTVAVLAILFMQIVQAFFMAGIVIWVRDCADHLSAIESALRVR